MSEPLLSTHGLKAFYGDFQALFGVDFEIGSGEVVALIGANGAGKSTFLKSVMGAIKVGADMVKLQGKPSGGLPPHLMVSNGVAIVPEGRRLFAGMSVEDNLRVAIDHKAGGSDTWTLDRIYKLFPILKDKRRDPVQSLSGGQQQMVSIGRALLSRPRILLMDEPSIGLAPKLFQDLLAPIRALQQREGLSILLVEQNVKEALKISDRAVVMKSGQLIWEGDPGELSDNDRLMELY